MKNEPVNCKNCETDFDKSFRFCPYCGQKKDDELTLGVLFYNTISNYFSFDARFFKSYIPLMFNPGYLPKRFVEGKRLLYLHPAQMYLFISVIFFFLFSIISRDQVRDVDIALKNDLNASQISDSLLVDDVVDSAKANEVALKLKANNIEIPDNVNLKRLDSLAEANNKKKLQNTTIFGFNKKKVDSLIALNVPDKQVEKAMGMPDDAGILKRKFYSQMLKFYKQPSGGSILQAFYDSIPIAMFILLPIFALLLKLFYYKKGRFSHHLVFTFYFFSFLFMVFSILILANLIFSISGFWIGMITVSTFFYLLLAVKRFYEEGYFSSFLKSSPVVFLFLSFVIPLATVIIAFSAFLFY